MSGDGFSALEQLQAKAMTYLEAENQQLRDALELIADSSASPQSRMTARAALDGTP